MATKERKISVGRRQQAMSPSPREHRTPDKILKNDLPVDAQKITATKANVKPKTSLVKKLAGGQTKKNQKKIALALNKKAKRKVNQKLAKSLINTARVLEAKKLLKNSKVRKRKIKEEIDDGPPVLEPIFPIEDNLDKKVQKKRVVRNPAARKIKVEPDDLDLNIDSTVSYGKKPKVKSECVDTISETIECVISGFSLTVDEIKKEPDYLSESSDLIRPKKLTKKQKLSLLQKEIKKENIENAITNIGPNDQKVIDMLDLNVLKVKKTYPLQKRRHTIEKYPMGSELSNNDVYPPFNLFPSLPKVNSSKSKRKVRSSLEGKVINPYTTRPPARLLRNGKQRKLKEHLLGGLDSTKRRKRLCSDFSEISKLSGYESDSSISDLSSTPGAESTYVKDIEIKHELIESSENNTTIITLELKTPSEIKRSLSIENQDYCTDTNSNVCSSLKPIDNEEKIVETVQTVFNTDIYPSPSTKVPEKLLILDIMKQTFNEKVEDSEDDVPLNIIRDANQDIPSTVQEEKPTDDKKMSEIISKLVETMGSAEFTATIKTTDEGPAVVMQNGDINNDVQWEGNTRNDEANPDPTQMFTDEIPLTMDQEITECPPITNGQPENQEEIKESPQEMETDTVVILEDQSQKIQEPLVDPEYQNPEPITMVPDLEPQAIVPIIETEIKETESVPSTSHCITATDISIQETEEQVARKESILNALGLRSLRAAEEAKMKEKERPATSKAETYTGTLKTVIKLNRDSKKKGRNHPLKMTLQKNKSRSGEGNTSTQDDYKIMKEGNNSWKQGGQSSDTAGAHRKTHYSNRSNLDGSSEHTSDGEAQNAEGPAKALVIPEKASSFSIHPERLCKDECSYCFGKFGLFDTPCHIAQIKSVERQDKILSIEKHLTRDSCLCDACYRHIDRKANTPSYVSKSFKRGPMIAPGPKENHCHVLGCSNVSTNVLRRKWIIKMKKQICQVINIDLDNPGLHSIPICDEHYIALEHLMVCAMCKRRLARNHIHYIGPEVVDLNKALQEEGVPLTLSDKPVVCKLCKCFATVILKDAEDRPDNCTDFFLEYKKRLLHFNNIVPMEESAAEEPIVVPTKEKLEPNKKKRKLSKNHTDENSRPESPMSEEKQQNSTNNEQNSNSGPESPSDYLVDYNSLIPSIAMECEDSEPLKERSKKNAPPKKMPNLEAIRNSVDVTVRDVSGDLAVQRLGSNPSLSVRQLFPGEEELGLQSNIDFSNVKEKTPEGWEKCNWILQYDKETKLLWQELQKPYGNQSSFLRHLILLEKYFRNGDLELKPNASQQSINYSESVQNRLRAYDNIPTGVTRSLNVIGTNNSRKPISGIVRSREIVQTSIPGLPIITSPNVSVTTIRRSPVTITQINNNSPNALIPVTISKAKPPPPPGLISLLPGTNRPIAPLVKPPQSQKIKFPITKNWRPTLIPIDPSKPPEKKTGLVQVISGGKPFHITLEDYKKMCAIKRSFEMKQKRQQELQKRSVQLIATPTSGSSLLKTNNKSMIITKAAKIEPKMENSEQGENILEKLDQQVENLELKLNDNKTILNMPKIPKSLTVIPQTVARKTSRPTSPVLLITQKPGPNVLSNKS